MAGFEKPLQYFPDHHDDPGDRQLDNDQPFNFEDLETMITEGSVSPEAKFDYDLSVHGKSLVTNTLERYQFFPWGPTSDSLMAQRITIENLIKKRQLSEDTAPQNMAYRLAFVIYEIKLRRMVDKFAKPDTRDVVTWLVKATLAARLGWERTFLGCLTEAVKIERKNFREYKIWWNARYNNTPLEYTSVFRGYVRRLQNLYFTIDEYLKERLEAGPLDPKFYEAVKDALPGTEEPDSNEVRPE